MRYIFLSICFLFSAGAHAQDYLRASSAGFFISPHLNGSSWTVEDLNIEEDDGGGLGLGLGYGFNQTFALFLNVDGTQIDPDEGEEYTLGHLDLGVRIHFLRPARPIRLYGLAALSGRGAEFEIGPADVEVSGGALTLGGGFMYFFNRSLALDLALLGGFGELTNVEGGAFDAETELDASLGRFNIGVTWFPNR